MTSLNAKRRGVEKGKARYLVVFVHGYGADGNDLLSLADPLGEHMPDAVFYAPDAPNRCSMNPMGFEWFPIPWIDGSDEETARAGMASAAKKLNQWLDDTMKEEGTGPAETILIGFSQGTMLSLHIAPRRSEPLAGIVGFSGRLLDPETLKDEVVSRPPVLLIHGDMDDVVPPSSLPQAADALVENGFETYTHISKNIGHGIAPDGLGLALSFMKDKLKLT